MYKPRMNKMELKQIYIPHTRNILNFVKENIYIEIHTKIVLVNKLYLV